MSGKKNQHFVPQFYLRNFSKYQDEKTIGLFNPKQKLFIPSTSIKNQSAKNFFYGKDGIIEEGLSQIESILAPKLAALATSYDIPEKHSDKHIALLTFVILSDLRNPTHIDQIKSFTSLMNREIRDFGKSNSDQDDFVPDISHEYAVQLSLQTYDSVLQVILDLDYKLLSIPDGAALLTSDFPVIKYNQFLEKKEIHGSTCGYSTLGLQIFVPLNPDCCILFYDSSVYKVGNRKDKVIALSKNDVDQLNLLQLLNCWNNIYFNEKVSEFYVESLFEQSNNYRKANKTMASSHGVIKDGKVQENNQIIHLRPTELEVGLKIRGIKLTRRANTMDLGNHISPMRAKV